MGGPCRAHSPEGLTSFLGLETAGKRPGAQAGAFGPILLTLCHPSLRLSPPGNYPMLPGHLLPALIGTGGFVFTLKSTEAKARNIQILSPQVKPCQHRGECLLDSSVCVLSVSLSEYFCTWVPSFMSPCVSVCVYI